MKRIHFTISVVIISISSIIAAVWTRNFDFLNFALWAILIIGAAHVLSS